MYMRSSDYNASIFVQNATSAGLKDQSLTSVAKSFATFESKHLVIYTPHPFIPFITPSALEKNQPAASHPQDTCFLGTNFSHLIQQKTVRSLSGALLHDRDLVVTLLSIIVFRARMTLNRIQPVGVI